ncbi:MAG: wax ester/triacylglycerol synthase family O-acyltransferase [Candidatus Nanopelagicales bacterium]|nr:wax ester/triacylglycerol synthase family O-acyltransferase [Candidatus Nanopelagicales bacterium]MCU0299327.1 wax ester/triacylglycerol synthase family O-acyltransferase [Candidatus Nanopelagicales bacterium]
MTVPVASGDLTWLLMDRPNNLMYVHGVLQLGHTPDWADVEQVLQDRLIDKFPVFSRRAAKVDGTWVWEDDPDFALSNHVRRVTLPEPGTRDEAEAYISSRVSEPFDAQHPLWEMDLIEGLDGSSGEAMVLARFHHGIADGVRLVQLLLSLLDPLSEDAAPSTVGRSGKGSGPAGMAKGAARMVVSGTTDFVTGVGSAISRVGSIRPSLSQGWIHLREPSRIVDAATNVASEDNMLVNSWRSVGRLTLSGRSVDTVWSGTPGVAKKAAWVSGVPLTRIRDIGKANTVTINDVMLSAVALGVTEYLAGKGATSIDQVSWMIPISLKPIDAELPEELGNHFAVVMLSMPIGIRDPKQLLRETHSRMNRIKNSAEPMILYGVQRVVAETPPAVSVRLTNFVANKTVGIITNVPGPRAPMGLAGADVTGIMGWVPTSGDQPLGICIFSYNGEVNIGILADAELVPDPQELADLIESAIDDLAVTLKS